MNKIYGIDEDTNMNNFLIHKLITMVYFSIHTFLVLVLVIFIQVNCVLDL